MRSIALVVPGNVHSARTGGNLYDLRLAKALTEAGNDVVLAAVDGRWPVADVESERQLASTLHRFLAEASSPGARRVVIIDGLVGAACPRTVAEAAAGGLDLRMLIHLPLALEPGLDRSTAAQREASERAALQAVTSVLATSAWAAAELRRRHGIEHVDVAAPGVDPAMPARGSTPPRLLQVAALTPGKNQMDVVAALSDLTELDWTARLVGSLYRDPRYAAQVRAAIEEAGLSSRIVLTGEKTGAGLEQEWQAADLSLLPSAVETYGMVVTESLARGVPAVVRKGTGAAEALGRDERGQRPGFAITAAAAGRTADPGDGSGTTGGAAAELRAALREWLCDASLRKRVRAAALNRRDMLSGWDQTAQAVAAALQ